MMFAVKNTDSPFFGLGQSPEFEAMMRSAGLIAKTDANVMILGETGTGKELVARFLHKNSPRHNKPWIPVNCAALPVDLIESELFGHKAGAFTGAHGHRTGLVESAHGGTLFLDEVAELPLAVQAKLLRFLEGGEVRPLGQTHPRQVDARVIAATHKDLQAEVKTGAFRQDLFYRLFVAPIELPALRERGGDIDILLDHFSRELSSHHGLSTPVYSTALRQKLRKHPWPGNVRELKHFVERCVILFSGKVVEPGNVPGTWLAATPASTGWSLPAQGIKLADVERSLIMQAMERAQGNQTRAASLLGLTRDTLLYRLKKYCITTG